MSIINNFVYCSNTFGSFLLYTVYKVELEGGFAKDSLYFLAPRKTPMAFLIYQRRSIHQRTTTP